MCNENAVCAAKHVSMHNGSFSPIVLLFALWVSSMAVPESCGPRGGRGYSHSSYYTNGPHRKISLG